MMRAVIAGSIWRNNKTGNIYRVLHVGVHTENEEYMVIYQRCDWDKTNIWVRPMSIWYDKFTFVNYDISNSGCM